MNKQSFTKAAALAISLTGASLLGTQPAFALISGELSVGTRSGSFKNGSASSKTITGTSVQLAGHLDPIPFVPVAFGLRILNETFKPSMEDHGFKTLTSTAFVPEVEAWFPLGDLRPFGRIGYTLVSAYKGSLETTAPVVGTISGDVTYKSTGTRLAVGLDYSFIPLISLSAAVEQSTETLSPSEAKISGVDIKSGLEDVKFSSTAILVGVKAGL